MFSNGIIPLFVLIWNLVCRPDERTELYQIITNFLEYEFFVKFITATQPQWDWRGMYHACKDKKLILNYDRKIRKERPLGRAGE